MICLHWVALKKGLLTGASKSTNANTCMHYCGGYVFFVLFSREFENKMATFPRAMKNESVYLPLQRLCDRTISRKTS